MELEIIFRYFLSYYVWIPSHHF